MNTNTKATSARARVQNRWLRHSTVTRVAPTCCIIALAIWPAPSAANSNPEPDAVRHAIQRSVPFIEHQGAEWIAKKDCISCHHTAFMVWSLNAATRNGVPVDQTKLDAWTEWATNWKHLVVASVRATAVREDTLRDQPDTLAQLLLGRSSLIPGATRRQWFVEYASDLVKEQQDDGSWISGGQLPSQKRPKARDAGSQYDVGILALHATDVPDAARATVLKKARAWLGVQTSGQSTEWWATRLMLERRLGRADKANQLRAELLKRQRADGGWGWLCDDDSDALGTGIALYALAGDQLPPNHPAIANASRFLLKTQYADGSWPVRGTKQNKKDHVQPTATYWGTCWAVIGLCETLDCTSAK